MAGVSSAASSAATSSALISGGASVLGGALDTTINNLFQSGVINAQKQYIQMQTQLAVLSNQQQQALAEQVNNTQDSNEKLQILTNAVAQIQAAQVTAGGKQQSTTLIIIVAGAFALLISAVIIKKAMSK